MLAPWCEILLFMSEGERERNYTEWIQITYTFIIFYLWLSTILAAGIGAWNNQAIEVFIAHTIERASCAWRAIKKSLSFCYDRTTFINGMSRVKDSYRELLRAVLAYLRTLPKAQQKHTLPRPSDRREMNVHMRKYDRLCAVDRQCQPFGHERRSIAGSCPLLFLSLRRKAKSGHSAWGWAAQRSINRSADSNRRRIVQRWIMNKRLNNCLS